MTFFEALFLGILQGLTEFLPISSSGHLTLFQNLFGLKDLESLVLFNLTIHLGTLASIFCVFKQQIKEALTDKKQLIGLSLAILPLFPLLLLIKPIKSVFDSPQYLGYFFMLTSGLLYLGIRFGKAKASEHEWRDSFAIGIFQALAILPGVSRSGSTVSGARIMGWSYQKALSFSFLLAIPTILGGVLIECLQLWKGTATIHADTTLIHYIIGFCSAFFVGFFTLKGLIHLGTSDKWMIFVWYCLILGICTTLYFNS